MRVASPLDATRCGRRPIRGNLFAWPLGRGFFAVADDPTVRLDASDAAGQTGHAFRRRLDTMILRMRLLYGDSVPPQSLAPCIPVELPGWGEMLRRAQFVTTARLRGATLLFPDAGALKMLDASEAAKLIRIGVARAVFFQLFRHDLVSYRFRRFSFAERLRRARVLWPRRSAVFMQIRARSDGAKGYWSPVLRNLPETEDVELSGRFLLFEGLRQLVPSSLPHQDIRQHGGGRYSVWSRRCFFAPLTALGGWARPYWVVEKTADIEQWLEITPDWAESSKIDWRQFVAIVEPRLAREERLPCGFKLRRGDRVALVTHGLPPGGAERQWCYLAAGLKAAGYEVLFAITDSLDGPNGHYLPLLKSYGIEPIVLGAEPTAGVPSIAGDHEAARLLASEINPFGVALGLLVGYLERVKPKAVFAQLEPVNLLAGVACHLAGVPKVVLSFRNYNPSRFPYLDFPWFQPLYRALSRSPRVSMSGNSKAGNDDYAHWIGIPPDQVCWIPNAIDAGDFADPTVAELARLRSELSLEEGQAVILGVFRLSAEKQPELFVRVCALVASRIPRLRVLLVGVGPMQTRVHEAIREASLDAMLLGQRSDVMALMKLSSLVLLTSRHEGMPNVLMEAQLASVPVVATRVGGTLSCVSDGVSGFLLAPDDSDGLASACVRVLTEPGLGSRMGREGASYMRSYFTKERLAMLHISLIDCLDSDTVPYVS